MVLQKAEVRRIAAKVKEVYPMFPFCWVFHIPLHPAGENTSENDNSTKKHHNDRTATEQKHTETPTKRKKTRTKSNIFCVSVAVSPAQMITWKPLPINRCTTFGKGTIEMMSESLRRKTPVFRTLTSRQSRRRKTMEAMLFFWEFLTYWKVERCPQDVG